MGLLSLFKRSEKGSPLTTVEVDGNWQKIMELFPTPAAGSTDIGKVPVLKANKAGFEYASLPQAGAGIKRFPKDSSLTSEHIGLLAMQRVVALNNNPQSIADFDVKAVLANTVPPESGQKGTYSISLHNIKLVKPETKIVRIYFNQQPLNSHNLRFYTANNGLGDNILTFKLPANLVSGTDDVEIGATIDDTIANVVAHFAAGSTQLTQYRARVDSYSISEKYIDFEMLWGEDDFIKYKIDSFIVSGLDYFNGAVIRSGDNLVDGYENVIAITYDATDNGDGYYPVTAIGGLSNSLSSNIFVRISDGALYTNIDGDGLLNYTEITALSRGDFDGKLSLFIPGNVKRGEYIYAFPGYYTISSAIPPATEIRKIDVNAALQAESIYNNSGLFGGNYLVAASSWDSGNSSSAIIDLRDIYRNDSGQPNGEFGAFGLKYFVDDADAIAALNWAISQNANFQLMFDISSVIVSTGSNVYYLEVQNKTAPTGSGYSYFNTNIFQNVYCNTNTLEDATGGRPERIPNAIIGKIVGVDGNDVLIDSSFLFDLKMCSEVDGAFGILPYSDDFNYGSYIPAVIAWRNGTVIDLAGYFNLMQNAGFSGENVFLAPMLVGGLFRPVNAAAPDGQVTIDGKSTFFFN